MPAATRLTRDADGRPVLEKTGPPDRRHHETEVLRRVAGPGVVDLVDASEGRIVLRFVSGPTLAGGVPVDRLAGLGTAVAATLADAHDRGVVHRRLTADHVIVPADGPPVVCGWADARIVGSPAGALGADDVIGLGTLLISCLDEAGDGTDRHDAVARAIRVAATRATAADPAIRPSMRALAAALAPAPGPILPRTEPEPRSRLTVVDALGDRRRTVLVGAPLAVVLGVALLVIPRTMPGPSGDGQAARPAATSPTSTPATTSTSSARRAEPTTATRVWPAPDPDPVVDGEGGRWAVGRAGDVVTVGDWDCDGSPEPAVLRPDTGQVWVFTGWDDGAEGIPAGRHPGATGLTADDPDGDGCASLAVVGP